jgi:integrase/recombinase XerD
MLNLYRRHTPNCPHRSKGQNYTRCSCPIWCDGELNGKRYRKSVGLRDWARAVKRTEKWEVKPEQTGAVMGLRQCIDSYLGDCRARKLKDSTITRYETILAHLENYCCGRGAVDADQIDLALLTDFRASRNVKPSTSRKELKTLRSFGAFAKKRAWMAENFAKELAPPKEDSSPTLPFEPDEVGRILDACDNLEDGNPSTRDRTRERAKAMCLVLLYSGMRISDTIQLKRSAVDLKTGKLLLRVMKTGAPLYVRLGEPATDALAALPNESEYFFWNGRSKLSTAVGNARKTIDRVLAVASVTGGHPHRFRDTFSVELLSKGEDLRTVQLLLGHTSIKTTEKHYAPFVQSFQRILDAATAKLDFGTRFGTRVKNTGKLLKIRRAFGGS